MPCKALENGLFSSKEFAEWSKENVMFLHVTTKLKDRQHDGLLREKAMSGFPSMAFMDDRGSVIRRHSGPRTLEGLTKTAEEGDSYLALRKAARSGDRSARQRLFVENLQLGRYDFARGSLKLATFRGAMSAKLRARATQHLVDLQYHELTRRMRELSDHIPGEEYIARSRLLNVEFFQAGRLPSGWDANYVLVDVMDHARVLKNAALFGKALEMYKNRFGDHPQAAKRIPRFERQLAGLNRRK